jgi:hypothetical protein
MIVLFEVGNPYRLSGVPEGVYQVFENRHWTVGIANAHIFPALLSAPLILLIDRLTTNN